MTRHALTLALLATTSVARADDTPIEDNSFLVEEAYNQEPNVVHHIEVMQLDFASNDWTSTFTEEWPANDQDDQVSVAVPIRHVGDATGLGDVMLNYRRELFRDPDERLVVTPRVSLSLPSGNATRELGEGGTALQVQACISIRPGATLALHSNVGVTVPLSGDASASSVTLAQSLVWLAHPKLNLLGEVVSVLPVPGQDPGMTTAQVVLSPGVRTAIDLGDLRIVPGVAAPVTLESGAQSWGLLLYVSFEHPLPVSRHEKEEG